METVASETLVFSTFISKPRVPQHVSSKHSLQWMTSSKLITAVAVPVLKHHDEKMTGRLGTEGGEGNSPRILKLRRQNRLTE
jgi:hypothetical protein